MVKVLRIVVCVCVCLCVHALCVRERQTYRDREFFLCCVFATLILYTERERINPICQRVSVRGKPRLCVCPGTINA